MLGCKDSYGNQLNPKHKGLEYLKSPRGAI